MTNYGIEGWKITGQTDDFDKAVQIRENSMSNGNSEVQIFKTVRLTISETK